MSQPLTIQMQLVESMTQYVGQVATPNGSGHEQLAAMLNAWVSFAKENPDHIRFIQLFDINYEVVHFQPELKDTYERFIQNGKENHFLLQALISGAADGSIRNATLRLSWRSSYLR